jgi:hypothetical protein
LARLCDALLASELLFHFCVTELRAHPYAHLRGTGTDCHFLEHALLDLRQAAIDHFERVYQYLRRHPQKMTTSPLGLFQSTL